ncbi:MAG: hypothetical protein EBU66_04370 [Bacteroidetes bacterium]|nr:hypothetical protein [bacterium]NBP63903.1 hypothetical protein [Bacteroidota bacterium]
MDAYDVYRLYMAIKLHFTTESYDISKTKGRVKDCRNSFLKRKDIMAFRKLGERYSQREIIDFLVANFTRGDKYGGVYDAEAEEAYEDWKIRQQKLSYVFKQDVNNILLHAEKNVEDPFVANEGKHPLIVRLYLGGKISLETVIILDKLFNFRYSNDTILQYDFMWKDISLLIEKYRIFVKIDKEKYLQLWNKEKGEVVY